MRYIYIFKKSLKIHTLRRLHIPDHNVQFISVIILIISKTILFAYFISFYVFLS